MTGKEAILEILKGMEQGGTAHDVSVRLLDKYPNAYKGKTPDASIQANLGDFIRSNDYRVKRFKKDNVYWYYHSDNETNLTVDTLEEGSVEYEVTAVDPQQKSYKERDLHPLLVTFQKGKSVYTKTIFHEASNKSEEHQKWVHPDMIGAKLISYKDDACQQFFKATSNDKSVEIYSYELKKEINNDYELKRFFFQAVSNSSWANYGYLVSYEIGDDLLDELERLNNSFGIGVILLKANPYESRVLFQARRRELDFRTISKLCSANKGFREFFEQMEKIITAEKKFVGDVMRGLESICDKPLGSESDIEKYCEAKNIPSNI